MGKYMEIKWYGRSGQGVLTAIEWMAEVLANEGKYIQAFPECMAQKLRPSVISIIRISDVPIKGQMPGSISRADVVVVMDPRLLMAKEIKENAAEDAVYIINTVHDPLYVREKVKLDNSIYTLDADTIAREEIGVALPNIPLMTVVVDILKLFPMDKFRENIKAFLSTRLSPEAVALNMATVQRAIREVRSA